MYRYSLDSKQKFTCPGCGHVNKFVRYIDTTTGNYIDGFYGRCDRQDKCGYNESPTQEFIKESQGVIKYVLKDLNNSDELDLPRYIKYFHRINPSLHYDNQLIYDNIRYNTLLMGLAEIFGIEKVQEAFDMYLLGMFVDGATIFPYLYDNRLKTAKIVFFNEDLHRNKDRYPIWLHSFKTVDFTTHDGRPDILDNPFYNTEYEYYLKHPDEYINEDEEDIPRKYNLAIPLFGWDLIGKYPNKTICLVESEKTAIICSIVFPEFNWLATGGKGFLQSYKFIYYSGRTWLFFPDLGKNNKTKVTTKDYWKSKVKGISEKYSMFYYFIDFVPEPLTPNNNLSEVFQQYTFNTNAEINGFDIADYILDYKLKCNGYDNYIDYMTYVLSPYR